MLYFAYGSNMDIARLKKRCPSATFRCKAKLAGYKLAFTRFSTDNNCGAADVVKASSRVVWGVVFEIKGVERVKLDEAEGYKSGRAKNAYSPVKVNVYENGDVNRPLKVATYVVCSKEDTYQHPSKKYLGYLISGAKAAKLPPKYRRQIAGFETLP